MKAHVRFFVASCCCLSGLTSGTSAFAQNLLVSQAGPKYVANGIAAPAGTGFSVAVSADGNTAVIGAPRANGNVGTAFVYTRSGDSWVQQGPALVPVGIVGVGLFGVTAAISADGNTVALGAYGDNTQAGATFIFTRTNGVWSQQGTKLVGTGAVGAARQGTAVALSADGNSLLVGGTDDNGNVGAAWFFLRSNGVWSQQGAKLVGAGTVGAANFGGGVALSADGNTALVSGFFDNGGTGAGWVYTRSGGVWTQQGGKLLPAGATGAPLLGRSASLSADGNTAVLGGYHDNGNTGAVWVYTRAGGVWTQYGAKLTPTDPVAPSFFGQSVRLSADGQTLVSGGAADSGGVGAVRIFSRQNGVWTQVGNKLVPNDIVGAPGLGFSSSITGDGSGVWFGGDGDNGTGAAWFYTVKRVAALSLAALPARRVSDAPFTIVADSPSGSPLAFSGSTPAICSVSSTGLVTLTGQLGTCTITASDPGSTQVTGSTATGSFTVGPGTPASPQNVACSAGVGMVTCTFTPPAAPLGGAAAVPAVTGYTLSCVSANGNYTISGNTSPLVLTGLPLGVSLQCSVASVNSLGTGAGSAIATVQPYSLLSRRGGIDINGDGKGEIVISTGTGLQVGQLNAQNQIVFTNAAAPSARSRVLGIGDFGARGKSDLLLQDSDSGAVEFWVGFDGFIDSRRSVKSVKPGWVVEAVADLDGDGKSDIVWRYTGASPNPDDTGVVFVWFMNDGVLTEVKQRGGAPLAWNLVGAADLHGNGMADLVFVSPSNQVRLLTALANRQFLNEAVTGRVVQPGYVLTHLADFNGDGKADLFFENAAGQIEIWPMNGTAVQGWTNLGVPAPLKVFAIADLNGDGAADIVFKKPDNTLTVWLTNAGNLLAPTVIDNAGTVPAGAVVIEP